MFEKKMEEFCDRIRKAGRPFILYCAGRFGEIAYNCMLGYGMKPVCMCDNSPDKFGKKFFDLSLFNYKQCKEKYKDAIYLITSESQSTCNIIGTQLEADGKIKNKDYFLFLEFDYDASTSCYLEHIIKKFEIVLMGDLFPCRALSEMLYKKNIISKEKILYCSQLKNIENGETKWAGSTIATLEECREYYPNAVYFAVYKEVSDTVKEYSKKVKKIIYDSGIPNISFYFSNDYFYLRDYFKLQPGDKGKSVCAGGGLKPLGKIRIEDVDKVLFLFDSALSGTHFMNTVIDAHPNILTLGYNCLQGNLLFYIQELKNRVTLEEFPDKLFEVYQDHLCRDNLEAFERTFPDTEKFIHEFKSVVKGHENLSEKDLFISVYIAYHYMIFGEPQKADHRAGEVKPVLYLEPHSHYKSYQLLGTWLDGNFTEVVYLKLLRNAITRLGSFFRLSASCGNGYMEPNDVKGMGSLSLEQKCFREPEKNVIALRFEDIKLHPREALGYLLNRFKIPWSETLTETTINGRPSSYMSASKNPTTGYDLRPIYNAYEEYFSSFDRFRLDILYRKKQKAYGYPFLDLDFYQFQERQIDEFFRYPYKFGKYMRFENSEKEKRFWNELYEINWNAIKNLQEKKQYTDYYDYVHMKECNA